MKLSSLADIGKYLNLSQGLNVDNPGPTGASPASQPPGYGAAQRGVLSQLKDMLPSEQGYERPTLDDKDKSAVLRNFGLNLMGATKPGGGGLFASIGDAGKQASAYADELGQRNLSRKLAGQKAQMGYLGQLQDYLSGQQEFSAGREDEYFDRAVTGEKLGIDRQRATSLDDYRKNRVDLARAQEARERELDALRGGKLKAEIDNIRSEGSGGLDTGEVRLRTGGSAKLDDIRQLYRERYGKYDPETRQYSIGPQAPTLDEFFHEVVEPETDPFRSARPAPSMLEQLRGATGQNAPTYGPEPVVPLRGDFSNLWR